MINFQLFVVFPEVLNDEKKNMEKIILDHQN